MDINFELYRVFYEVAKTGNITKASAKLNITQPAISKAIKNLEEQLGGSLFIRSKKGVTLTKEGEIFFEYIKNAVESISNAENEFTNLINLESGTIRIGISTNLTESYFLPYLKRFHNLYPKINIQIITDVGANLLKELKNGLLDIVIMHFIDKDYGKEIAINKIKNIDSTFIASKEYKELISRKIYIKELIKYPFIMQIKGSSSRDVIDEYLDENSLNITPSVELSSYTLVPELVKLGLGIGLSTKEYVKKDIEAGNIIEINTIDKPKGRYIGYATLAKHINSFSTSKLIDLINKKDD